MAQHALKDKSPNSPQVDRKIEVLDLSLVDERFVKAKCRLRIDALVIDGVRIVHPTLGTPFVSLPQRKIGDEWLPIVNVLSPGLRADIDAAVLDAWRYALNGGRR